MNHLHTPGTVPAYYQDEPAIPPGFAVCPACHGSAVYQLVVLEHLPPVPVPCPFCDQRGFIRLGTQEERSHDFR